jgi:hypothetical protein
VHRGEVALEVAVAGSCHRPTPPFNSDVMEYSIAPLWHAVNDES